MKETIVSLAMAIVALFSAIQLNIGTATDSLNKGLAILLIFTAGIILSRARTKLEIQKDK